MPSNPRSMRSGPDGTSRPEAVTGRPAGAAATPNRPRGVLVFAANGSACDAYLETMASSESSGALDAETGVIRPPGRSCQPAEALLSGE